MEKTEYNETIEFFLVLCAFPVVSSTFDYITTEEKKEINMRIKVLTTYMSGIMPKLQEREAEHVRKNSNP